LAICSEPCGPTTHLVGYKSVLWKCGVVQASDIRNSRRQRQPS